MNTENTMVRQVSERKKVNEMDAVELTEYASTLSKKKDDCTITDDERHLLSLAKSNFKQMTGRPLTEATMVRQ